MNIPKGAENPRLIMQALHYLLKIPGRNCRVLEESCKAGQLVL